MARDYKTPPRRSGSRSSVGSFLAGLLVGLILGLVIAVGVAWYINKLPSPFITRTPPAKAEPQKPAEPAKAGRAEDKAAKPDEKRFSFYEILPGKEEAAAPKDAAKASTTAARETFYLQAGAFQTAADADNLKARLALLGIEAKIETAAVADKGTMHRVRAGPFAAVEQVNKTRETLRQNGIETQLIRIRETTETR